MIGGHHSLRNCVMKGLKHAVGPMGTTDDCSRFRSAKEPAVTVLGRMRTTVGNRIFADFINPNLGMKPYPRLTVDPVSHNWWPLRKQQREAFGLLQRRPGKDRGGES